MSKKYYIKDEGIQDTGLRSLIILDEKDIDEKIELAGLIYVKKKDVDNIEEYSIEFEDGDQDMLLADSEDYLFLDIDEATQIETDYILNGWLSDEEEEIATEEEVIKNIIDKMKKEGTTADLFETFKSYSYWDGSNWKEIVLEHWYYDSEYIDYTEELQNMKEIDYNRHNTGIDTLYKLTDNSIILISESFYQGSLWEVYFINDSNIKTIEDAIEYIRKREGCLY